MAIERRNWHGIQDRAKWRSGPWDYEPDKIQWTDTETGRDCLIVRGPAGALCGYVAVKPGESWYGIDYSGCTATPKCEDTWCDHSPGAICNVHGGLTYAAPCSEMGEHGICHVTDDPSDKAWWFGFDCAHSGDLSPSLFSKFGSTYGSRDETYRDIAYVQSQIEKLAKQISESQTEATR